MTPEAPSDATTGSRPIASVVVERIACLRAVSDRCFGEELFSDGVIDLAQLRAGSLWIERAGLSAFFTAAERGLLERALGTWPRAMVLSVSWRAECVGVFAWALRLVDALPPCDSPFAPDDLEKMFPLGEARESILSRSTIRSDAIVSAAREGALAWYWRSTTERILRDPDRAAQRTLAGGTIPDDDVLRAHIRNAAESARVGGFLTTTVEGDFPAFDQPFAALTDDQYWRIDTTLRERCRALNWLCGDNSNWDDVRTDT